MDARRPQRVPPRVSMIAIGNELLVGSTRDINIFELGNRTTAWGVDLAKASIIRDERQEIIQAVREQGKMYDYVITSGGIGPTHDDITAESIAAAFAVPLELNADAVQAMQGRSQKTLSAAARKMALIPQGATLIPNAVSAAPGFRLGNVFVLAGVPRIFAAMLDVVGEALSTGQPLHSRTVTVMAGESKIADKLTEMQRQNKKTQIGSYPQQDINGRYFVKAVWRSYDEQAVIAEIIRFKQWLDSAGIKYLN